MSKLYHYYDKGDWGDIYRLYIEMEKLIPLDNKKLEFVIPDLFDQLGIESDPDELHFSEEWGTEAMHETIRKESKNPAFNEAFDLVRGLAQHNVLDLHAQNWMVRLTGSGPQLVILDPFYYT